MRLRSAVLAHVLFWIADALIIGDHALRGWQAHAPTHTLKANDTHVLVKQNWKDRNHSLSSQARADANATYCQCNTTGCSADARKVKDDLQNNLVLIIGCSLDIFAIEYFCNSVGSSMQGFASRNPFSYLAHCDVGGFTVAYIFHPGASAPPYFSEYAGTATTQDIVKNSAYDVQMTFGREPNAIIVDASLWDVSNWWQRNGRPPFPFAVPTASVWQWCNQDVPQLLNWVKTVYPRSAVAFRTPPTVKLESNGYGQSPLIIDEMVKCIDQHVDPLNLLYGKFGLIDYHHFVDAVLLHAVGAPMQQYYKDSLHPGAKLSLMYINKVLNWARGLRQ
jgi:hypothetical protein